MLIIFTERDYEGSHNLKRAERRLILRAFEKAKEDRKKMATLLGITTRTLYNKLIQHGLENYDTRKD